MLLVLIFAIPLVAGLLGFVLKDSVARGWALLASLATLAVTLVAIRIPAGDAALKASWDWSVSLNTHFALGLDGVGKILCLLTALSFPVIFVATWKDQYRNPRNFFGLMLLSQAGLMGVFLATDALLFYFFWELALIPVYFLSSIWGGERRIAATFKFFIYTFVGSLLMLAGIVYISFLTRGHSFSLQAFQDLRNALPSKDQSWIFWLMFIAFAIKMPIFPFHTWQPDAYEQAPTAVTMVLSGIMVKMGLFGLIRWLAPVAPMGTYLWGDTVSTLCITGMIYASLVALRQDDLKRLVAYSSIAHMGLMCLAVFATTTAGIQGVMIQLFNHGINIIGLWIVVDLIERKFGTRKMSELGGLAQKAPGLAIALVIIALANIALPLTNAFAGEFLMFTGIYQSPATQYNVVFTVTAGLSIILSAVYTLNMIQKVFYGDTSAKTVHATDISINEKMVLGFLVVLIVLIGVYPAPLFHLTQDTVTALMKKMVYKP